MLEASIQRGVPVVAPKPVIMIFEPVALLVEKVTSLPPEIVKVEIALAAKVPLAVKVLVKVPVPVTARLPPMVSLLVTEALLRVARPEVETVEREELPVTDREEERVVVPVTVRVPPTAVLPVRVEVPSTVKFPLKEAPPLVSKVEPSPLTSYPPPILTVLNDAVALPAERVVAFGSESVWFLIVVVPVVPPIVRLVAPAKRLNVVLVEERVSPLTAKFPPKVVVLVPLRTDG